MTVLVGAPDVEVLPVGDGALAVDLRADVFYSLNAAGFEAWKVVSRGGTVGEAADALCGLFDVSREQARASVEQFVEEAVRLCLLSHSGNGQEAEVRT